MMRRMAARSSAVVSRRPASTHAFAAASHWARLKMKKIAGSMRALIEELDRLHPTRRSRTAPTSSRVRPSPPSTPAQARTGRFVELQGVAVGVAVDEHREHLQPVAASGPPRGTRSSSSTGRWRSTIAVVGPRTVVIHSASSVTLLTVADKQTSRTCCGQVDDDLLPHGTPVGVLEEVHLVEHDQSEVVERPRTPVDHVAEHLGRHHDDRGVAVDRVVPGEQTDGVLAVDGDQVAVLLVRQRLDRRGVERSMPGGASHGDAVLGHHGLAAPGRRGDDDVLAAIERVERLGLEPVDRERVAGGQLGAVGRRRRRSSRRSVAARSLVLGRRRTTSQPMSTATK